MVVKAKPKRTILKIERFIPLLPSADRRVPSASWKEARLFLGAGNHCRPPWNARQRYSALTHKGFDVFLARSGYAKKFETAKAARGGPACPPLQTGLVARARLGG